MGCATDATHATDIATTLSLQSVVPLVRDDKKRNVSSECTKSTVDDSSIKASRNRFEFAITFFVVDGPFMAAVVEIRR
jgi:hypothetical protein